MKLLASLLTAAALAAPVFSAFAAGDAPKAAKPDLVKGEASFTAVCAACHGADGNSAIAANPKLSQQHPEYLVKQLQEFKSGKRNNAIMKGFATALSDDDMRNIAYWVTTQKMTPGSATNKDTIALGEKIWRGGIASRGVPACAACHAPNGAGMPIKYPRLAGQHAGYTELQIKEFRDGIRTNDKVMPEVVNGMNDAQIKAVADFVQGLH